MGNRDAAIALLGPHIRAVEELDVLLLLVRAAAILGTASRTHPERILTRADPLVSDLVSRGLASRTASGIRFALKDLSLESAFLALARWNHVDRPELVVALSRTALARFRSEAQFGANATVPKKS